MTETIENPKARELIARVEEIRRSGRVPFGMSMSPETWDALYEEAFPEVRAVRGDEREFMGIPVTLSEGCLGVSIAYEREA